MAIKFLSKIKKWKDFSNLAPYPIKLDDTLWKSSEHYYQFKKFEKTDPKFAQKIKNAPTPKDAKKLSMENNNFPANWNDVKVEVLKVAVRKKFESYHQLKKLLLSTGNEELIEANHDDYFWGEGEDGSGKTLWAKF